MIRELTRLIMFTLGMTFLLGCTIMSTGCKKGLKAPTSIDEDSCTFTVESNDILSELDFQVMAGSHCNVPTEAFKEDCKVWSEGEHSLGNNYKYEVICEKYESNPGIDRVN